MVGAVEGKVAQRGELGRGCVATTTGQQSCVAPVSSRGPDDDGGDINWPSAGDQGLPDGFLTGGYCIRKWWWC
jgi:hypothetical protein